jgi:glycosyltransferase involved in cell wall biosynthesis
VFNAMQFLPTTIPSFLEAAANTGGVEVICLDNGSTDGSFEYLASLVSDSLRLERRAKVSISALRNWGAALGTGDLISFLDADVYVAPQYFNDALRVLSSSGASATGCEYDLPPNPGWIESAWHALHYTGRSRDVQYLNAGNFVVRRAAFNAVRGFMESLPTGEDAELGQRLIRAGHRIYATPEVAAIHLGNPKTIRGFYRRNVWHGVGMFGTVRRDAIDRPTAMMILHGVATVLGVGVLFFGSSAILSRFGLALALQFAVPLATIFYRALKIRRQFPPAQTLFLYWLYYWARLQALFLVVTRAERTYSK